jgi:hypothetical protein
MGPERSNLVGDAVKLPMAAIGRLIRRNAAPSLTGSYGSTLPYRQKPRYGKL